MLGARDDGYINAAEVRRPSLCSADATWALGQHADSDVEAILGQPAGPGAPGPA